MGGGPGFSVLIPHYSTPNCDQALCHLIRMLRENTIASHVEVIVVQGYNDPYLFWNEYSDRARYERIVFFNNDMLPAPGWDAYMERHTDDESLVTGYLVEPGVIPVASQNIEKDFGRTPGQFDQAAFHEFCSGYQAPEVREGSGWYMPLMVTKSLFRRVGKYPIERPFPHPNDTAFWANCRGKGVRFLQVRSFAYHFQNLSNAAHDRKRVAPAETEAS